MDYTKKVISITTGGGLPPAEYICTSHVGDQIEIVPLHPMHAGHLEFPRLNLTGKYAIQVHGCREDESLIKSTLEEYDSALLTWQIGLREEDVINTILGKTGLECVKTNLDRLSSAVTGLVPLTSKNDKFAEIYGGLVDSRFSEMDEFVDQLFGFSTPEGFREVGQIGDETMFELHDECCDGKCQVRKVLFIEFGDLFGEFIVIEQSEKYLYGVWAISAGTGYTFTRLPINEINVLSGRNDDEFISDFADRLDDMQIKDYGFEKVDAAETVVASLQNLIDQECFECGTLMDGNGTRTPIHDIKLTPDMPLPFYNSGFNFAELEQALMSRKGV